MPITIPMNVQRNAVKIIGQLKDNILYLERQNAELKAKLKWYEEQYRLSPKKQLCVSSGKTDLEQINLSEVVENSANPELEEPIQETITP